VRSSQPFLKHPTVSLSLLLLSIPPSGGYESRSCLIRQPDRVVARSHSPNCVSRTQSSRVPHSLTLPPLVSPTYALLDSATRVAGIAMRSQKRIDRGMSARAVGCRRTSRGKEERPSFRFIPAPMNDCCSPAARCLPLYSGLKQ
jgi:hypothetical protein